MTAIGAPTQQINKLEREEADDLNKYERLNAPDRHIWGIGSLLRTRDSIYTDVCSGTTAQLQEKSHIGTFPFGEC